jgi:hypothetical protein
MAASNFVPRQASGEGALKINELDVRQDELLAQLAELEEKSQSLLAAWTKKRTPDSDENGEEEGTTAEAETPSESANRAAA